MKRSKEWLLPRNLYIRVAYEFPNDLRPRMFGYEKISGKSQNFIDLVFSPTPEMKILSALVKISWKKEVELFP